MDPVLAATLQAQLALMIQALQTEVEQLREYSDALNDRCIADTAELGRLRAELDVAVATERERCAMLCIEDAKRRTAEAARHHKALPDVAIAWHAGAAAATACAAAIRGA